MNNFERNLKYIAKKDFEITESYESSVNDALEYIYNMQSSSKKVDNKKVNNKFVGILQKVAAIVLAGALSVTVYAGITGNLSFEKMGLNKLSQNYEDNKVVINEKIDNEYFTLSLENIAIDSAYTIIEYKINLKEKALNDFNEITYNENIGYTIGIGSTVEINGKKDHFYITHTEKESDTEYSYYQILYTMANDEEVMNLKIWINYLWTGGYMNQTVQIDEVFKISSKIDKLEKLNFEEQRQELDDGSILILDKVLNTNFQTFVRVKREINNISYQEYQNRNTLQYKTFLITDENDNLIPYRTYTGDIIGTNYYLTDTGEEIGRENLYKLKNEDLINVEENYVVLLDDAQDLNKIKVIPIKSRLYNDRTDEEREMYNKAIWYPVVEGDKIYSKQSNLGGILEINNIKIDDENIVFNYNKKGIVENGTSYVLIRNKNMKMNYICSIKQDVTNSGEVIFGRDLVRATGLEIRQGMLDNIEELEFTLLFGKVTEFDGKPFETIMPEFSSQKLKIDNITREKSYTKIIKCYINSNERNYVVEYDSNDNLLEFNGYTNDLYYKNGETTERIVINDYEKATDLINDIGKILNYKNIEFTIE